MLLLVLISTFEKNSQKTVHNCVQCPDCCRIVFWINLFMMAAFQLYQRVWLTWFLPHRVHTRTHTHMHTHMHTKGSWPLNLKFLFRLSICPVCVCWLSFMHCLQLHMHTLTLNKSPWRRVPLRKNGLLFSGVVCFYGNSLSKTLTFIHIYFADTKNKLMFNLEALWVLEERKL